MFQLNERLMITLGCKLNISPHYLAVINIIINDRSIVFSVLDTKINELHSVEIEYKKGDVIKC